MLNWPPILSPRLFVSIGVSVLILGTIYWKIEISSIINILLQMDGIILVAALSILIPTIILSALRFRMLLQGQNRPSLAVATKLILAASTMNVVLPSKMGDMLKSIFMRQTLNMRISMAICVVVFEKACDLLGLLLWGLLGLIVYAADDKIFIIIAIGCGLAFGILMLSSRSFADWFFRLASKIAPSSLTEKFNYLRKSWAEVHSYFWRSWRDVINIVGITLLIWFLQLIQIWLFAAALHATTPFFSSLGLSSLAILAGLVPFTMAGIGTRDAAVIFLFAPFMPAAAAAALGLMLTLRYLVVGLAGLPFLAKYLDMLRQQQG